jgi:hypothetical protein
MDKLITMLAPVFAAGLAVQQLLEILTSILDLDARQAFQKYKKVILGLVALIVGFILAYKGYLQVLHPLFVAETKIDPVTHQVTFYYSRDIPDSLDFIVTGLVISAGTEGINSILKFLKYKKEETKNDAAAKSPENTAAAKPAGSPVPAAVAAMNRK